MHLGIELLGFKVIRRRLRGKTRLDTAHAIGPKSSSEKIQEARSGWRRAGSRTVRVPEGLKRPEGVLRHFGYLISSLLMPYRAQSPTDAAFSGHLNENLMNLFVASSSLPHTQRVAERDVSPSQRSASWVSPNRATRLKLTRRSLLSSHICPVSLSPKQPQTAPNSRP